MNETVPKETASVEEITVVSDSDLITVENTDASLDEICVESVADLATGANDDESVEVIWVVSVTGTDTLGVFVSDDPIRVESDLVNVIVGKATDSDELIFVESEVEIITNGVEESLELMLVVSEAVISAPPETTTLDDSDEPICVASEPGKSITAFDVSEEDI